MRAIHLKQLEHIDRSQLDLETRIAVRLFVPSYMVSVFTLPTANLPRRLLGKAIPSLLEERLAEPLDRVQFAYQQMADQQTLAFVCQKRKITEWLELSRLSGFDVQTIYPDFYLLPYTPGQVSTAISEGYTISRVGENCGFSGSADVVKALSDGSGPVVDVGSDWIEWIDSTCTESIITEEHLPSAALSYQNTHPSNARVFSQRYRKVILLIACVYLLTLASIAMMTEVYEIKGSRLKLVVQESLAGLVIDLGRQEIELEYLKQAFQRKAEAGDKNALIKTLRDINDQVGRASNVVPQELKYNDGQFTLMVRGNAAALIKFFEEQPYYADVVNVSQGSLQRISFKWEQRN